MRPHIDPGSAVSGNASSKTPVAVGALTTGTEQIKGVQRELQDLRGLVQQLQQRITQLESRRRR